jgi:hypothetical protein
MLSHQHTPYHHTAYKFWSLSVSFSWDYIAWKWCCLWIWQLPDWLPNSLRGYIIYHRYGTMYQRSTLISTLSHIFYCVHAFLNCTQNKKNTVYARIYLVLWCYYKMAHKTVPAYSSSLTVCISGHHPSVALREEKSLCPATYKEGI